MLSFCLPSTWLPRSPNPSLPQVFFSKHNPIFAKGLSPLMRWMYGRCEPGGSGRVTNMSPLRSRARIGNQLIEQLQVTVSRPTGKQQRQQPRCSTIGSE